jgi:hypothetical protein
MNLIFIIRVVLDKNQKTCALNFGKMLGYLLTEKPVYIA